MDIQLMRNKTSLDKPSGFVTVYERKYPRCVFVKLWPNVRITKHCQVSSARGSKLHQLYVPTDLLTVEAIT